MQSRMRTLTNTTHLRPDFWIVSTSLNVHIRTLFRWSASAEGRDRNKVESGIHLLVRKCFQTTQTVERCGPSCQILLSTFTWRVQERVQKGCHAKSIESAIFVDLRLNSFSLPQFFLYVPQEWLICSGGLDWFKNKTSNQPDSGSADRFRWLPVEQNRLQKVLERSDRWALIRMVVSILICLHETAN